MPRSLHARSAVAKYCACSPSSQFSYKLPVLAIFDPQSRTKGQKGSSLVISPAVVATICGEMDNNREDPGANKILFFFVKSVTTFLLIRAGAK